VAAVEVAEVGVGVVDAGDEAQPAAIEQPLQPAVEALGEGRVHAEAGSAERDRVGDLEHRAQIGIAAVGGGRHERVEQVQAAGDEDVDQHRRVGRGRRARLAGLERARQRHRLRRVQGDRRAQAGLQQAPAADRARERRAALGIGAGEVVAVGH
jgi:hypothetical protein